MLQYYRNGPITSSDYINSVHIIMYSPATTDRCAHEENNQQIIEAPAHFEPCLAAEKLSKQFSIGEARIQCDLAGQPFTEYAKDFGCLSEMYLGPMMISVKRQKPKLKAAYETLRN